MNGWLLVSLFSPPPPPPPLQQIAPASWVAVTGIQKRCFYQPSPSSSSFPHRSESQTSLPKGDFSFLPSLSSNKSPFPPSLPPSPPPLASIADDIILHMTCQYSLLPPPPHPPFLSSSPLWASSRTESFFRGGGGDWFFFSFLFPSLSSPPPPVHPPRSSTVELRYIRYSDIASTAKYWLLRGGIETESNAS